MLRSFIMRIVLATLPVASYASCAQAQSPVEVKMREVQKIVFDGPRSLNAMASTIDGFVLVVDPMASKPRRLVDGEDPTWSPDGKQVAYCRRSGFFFDQIQLINADGTDHRELTHLKGGTCLPDWSPDGKSIAFTFYTNTIPITAAIMVMDKNGDHVRQIAEGYAPRWSPDGQQILFVKNPEKRGDEGSIWVVNADGAEARKLAYYQSETPSPSWFPDGRKIVFASMLNKRSVIYSVNLDGSDLKEILGQEPFDCFFPLVSPDGKDFVVDVFSSGKEPSVVLIDGATRRGTLLAHGSHPSILWNGR